MVFAGVVCPVGVSSGPQEAEQLLCCSALDPLEPHVIGLGLLGGHGANGKAMGGVVVSGDWCGLRLRMPHFFESCAVRHDGLASIVEGTSFCF